MDFEKVGSSSTGGGSMQKVGGLKELGCGKVFVKLFKGVRNCSPGASAISVLGKVVHAVAYGCTPLWLYTSLIHHKNACQRT